MKKIYILASAIVLASVSFGQSGIASKKDAFPVHSEVSKKSSEVILKKAAPGDIFWYEDFANGVGGNAVDGSGTPIGGTITWLAGDNGSGYANVWQQDFDGPNGFYEDNGPLKSESTANGFMIFDANKQTDTDNPGNFITIDGYLESPAINISALGTTNLAFEIQHNYRTCCAGGDYPVDIFVGYYDNGSATWVWTEKSSGNTAHNVYPSPVESDGYVPEVRLINAVDAATSALANTSEIKIRFHWNSTGNASNSYYAWMIDDVRLKEIPDFDIRLDDMYTGDIINDYEYYAIPEVQIPNYPAILGAEIGSLGASTANNVNFTATITDPSAATVYSGSSTTTSLASGANVQQWLNSGFIPDAGAYGEYTVSMTANQADTDFNPSDNTLSKKFALTKSEFGHYNPNSDNLGLAFVNDDTNPGGLVMSYLFYEDAVIYGIRILLADGATTVTDVGQTAIVGVYTDDGTSFVPVSTQEFEITSGMIGTETIIYLDNPVEVFFEDFYYAAIYSFGGGENMLLASDRDGDLDNSTLTDRNGTIYGESRDFFVNLWFDEPESTISNSLNVSSTVVPNPATYNAEVRYSIATAADINLEITDVTGKIVKSENLGSKVAGDYVYELNTSDLADGIYYYTLVAGQNRLTNKLVIRK